MRILICRFTVLSAQSISIPRGIFADGCTHPIVAGKLQTRISWQVDRAVQLARAVRTRAVRAPGAVNELAYDVPGVCLCSPVQEAPPDARRAGLSGLEDTARESDGAQRREESYQNGPHLA